MDILKKYKNKFHTATIYTVYGINEDGAAVCETLHYDGSKGGVLIGKKYFSEYVEYKEPKKGTFWLNVYEKGCGVGWTTQRVFAERDISESKLLACVEVPWVEGQGLEKKKCSKCNGTGWLEDKIGDGGRSCRCDCC